MKSEQLVAALLGPAVALACAAGAMANEDADARFRGPPSYDLV